MSCLSKEQHAFQMWVVGQGGPSGLTDKTITSIQGTNPLQMWEESIGEVAQRQHLSFQKSNSATINPQITTSPGLS